MTKGLTVAAAVVLLVAGGAVEIVRSGKSATDAQVLDARAKLNAIPMDFAGWTGTGQEPNLKELEQARADAYLSRVYTRETPKGKESVTVLIMAGNPKEMGAHDPKVCYVSAGYAQKGNETKLTVPAPTGPADTFWTVKFEGDRVSPPLQQVAWAWTADGTWVASGQPRIEFAQVPLLYKVYVSRAMSKVAPPDDRDTTLDLLKDLLPEVRKALAPAT
jgi:hypothetical protein